MEKRLLIRKHSKGNFEVVFFEGRTGQASYQNFLDQDSTKLAIVLLDLEMTTGLPIRDAVKKYLAKRDSRDWLGL